ncbi:MAG: radical SAM protein [Planctomycetota bacterium]
MKLSRFTTFFPASGGDSFIGFNAMTQGVVTLPGELKRRVEDAFRRRDFSNGAGEAVRALDEAGLLVADDVDETDRLRRWFDDMREDADFLQATVLTTEACNFACPYCIQGSDKGAERLDDARTDRVTDWILRKAAEHGHDRVVLTFYGGEPFLNPEPMIRISQRMADWARERGGREYRFEIVTNGSLIRPDVVERLRPLGLYSLRVTIDGDREEHDRRRPFRGGQGSFDTVVANLQAMAGRVDIQIQSNWDRGNYESLFRLWDYLAEVGLLDRCAGVRASPVSMSLENRRAGLPANAEAAGCISFSGAGYEMEVVAIREELLRRGCRPGPAVGIQECPLGQRTSYFVIRPNGDIHKCPAMLGEEGMKVGRVDAPALDARHEAFVNLDVWKACPDCVYAPMCGGGCRYSAILQTGDVTRPACEKAYLDRVIPRFLEQDMRYGRM